MFAIQLSHFFWRALAESILHRHSHARRRPHISNVKILGSIVVVIEPADTHAGADVFNLRLRSNVGKSSIAIVAIKILAAEVVHHVEIRPAVIVVIAPSAAKTVARVVAVEARLMKFGGPFSES